MPTITYTLNDGFGTVGKQLKLKWRPAAVRLSDGQLVVDSAPARDIYSTVGTAKTVTGIAAGPWAISNLGKAAKHETIFIDVPAEGGDVTAQIAAAVSIPPNTPVSELWAAAQAAAEGAIEGLDVVSKEVADATYAPLWKANTVYAAGAKVISPTTGDVISRTTAGTSRTTFDSTEQSVWARAYAPATVPDPIAMSIALGGGF
ncbi:hypothetical protein SEA_GUDMIT_27 [Gordonia phage Gudmit]|nr:hypothetical protein SEA_GUDMIT_27 [Gordonia phage Gudmit]